MSRKSYQEEIPKSRINLTLDWGKENVQIKRELPLKLLVLGNFSGTQHEVGNDVAEVNQLWQKEPLTLTKANKESVMKKIKPTLNLLVDNKITGEGQLPVSLELKCFKDFQPQSIVHQVPALQRLLAIRKLLKELKATIVDDKNIRQELNALLQDSKAREQLKSVLNAKGLGDQHDA